MRQIVEYINHTHNESKGSKFKEQIKYSKSDWDKWKKEAKEVFIGNYDEDPDLELAYIPNHKDRIMDHIGTYNKKTKVLFCDDIELFGHEIK